ncbi:MAG: alpha/beta hydrolase [Yaniella sp.]|uniref:alpha/beta hydrolase n=2 Tax=Yaniella sp. TaxID=2773929 RepID=UPI0026480D23|nr:alpha/beta hydrolase [Yaniella sp.]MDN5815591.1 alpha/beta hydrolase [Yaniella sp.]MDN5818419.1 alpha/beta hydrolase [Yaniella sp.]
MMNSRRKHTLRRRPRRMLVTAGVLVAVIAIVGVLMWSLQRSMIYFPDTSEVPAAADVLEGGQDLTLHTSDGLELEAWFAPPTEDAVDRDMAVLMAPGNGGNREGRAGLAQHLQDRGFSVLLMDYRGYSTNPGRPSENGLIRDGLAATDALEAQGFAPDQTIYFGESVGGGVVAALLIQRPPAAAVFRSPFTDLAEVGKRHYPWLPVGILLRDRFSVTEHVSRTQVPISVIRARHDTVVPAELSAQVAAAAPNLVEEHVLDDADHNDPVMFGPEIADVVVRIADEVS